MTLYNLLEVIQIPNIRDDYFGYEVLSEIDEKNKFNSTTLARFWSKKEDSVYNLKKKLHKKSIPLGEAISLRSADRALYKMVREFVAEKKYSSLSLCHPIFSGSDVAIVSARDE